MKLSEYLGSDNIFQHLITINPELVFLTDEKVRTMDYLLKINHGDRTVFSKIVPYGLVMVAEFLNDLHSENWLRLVELNVMQNNLATDVRTITETIDETENNQNVTESVNKVSAFNSDELITDDGNNSTTNGDKTGNKTRTLTDSRTNLLNQYNNLSLIHKNNIMTIVLNDVKDFLTLNIYE